MAPKWSIFPEQKIFGKNLYYFYLPIGPFHCPKFKKILTADPELWRCTIFGPKMVHLLRIIFWEIITIILIYLLAPFIMQNFKRFFQQIRSYKDVQFLCPKRPVSSNKNFFRKPVHESCFFYSCLSTCQKSKSDINLLVKYWWFKNTEILLAESHFSLHLRTRFFQSMQFLQDVNEP